MPKALQQFGVSRENVLRLAGSAFTKKRRRYQVKPMDRLLRVMVIPGKKSLREIVLKDSREASFVGAYWGAVERFLVHGDASALAKLRRKTVMEQPVDASDSYWILLN